MIRRITPLILIRDTRWEWVASFTNRPLYFRGKISDIHSIGGAGQQVTPKRRGTCPTNCTAWLGASCAPTADLADGHNRCRVATHFRTRSRGYDGDWSLWLAQALTRFCRISFGCFTLVGFRRHILLWVYWWVLKKHLAHKVAIKWEVKKKTARPILLAVRHFCDAVERNAEHFRNLCSKMYKSQT